MFVFERVWSLDSKNVSFLSVRGRELLQTPDWKNDVTTDTVFFFAICLPTIDITTWNWACLKSRDGSATYIPFFKSSECFEF